MAKKPQPKKVVHDFSINKTFRGWLISETPEELEFENEDGETVFIERSDALTNCMKALVNGTPVNELDALIEITYLGQRENRMKFKIDVELDETE